MSNSRETKTQRRDGAGGVGGRSCILFCSPCLTQVAGWSVLSLHSPAPLPFPVIWPGAPPACPSSGLCSTRAFPAVLPTLALQPGHKAQGKRGSHKKTLQGELDPNLERHAHPVGMCLYAQVPTQVHMAIHRRTYMRTHVHTHTVSTFLVAARLWPENLRGT